MTQVSSIAALDVTLRCVARLERAGLRPARLTDPVLARWERVRRMLGLRDLFAILCEDLAGAWPVPFDLSRWSVDPTAALDDGAAAPLLEAARAPQAEDATAFLRDCARALGLPTGGAIAELPRPQPHHRVLELPGSFGRIAAFQCARYEGLGLERQYTVVADTDAERALVGAVAVELRAAAPRVVTRAALGGELAAGARFDRVFGLSEDPDARALAAGLPDARLV